MQDEKINFAELTEEVAGLLEAEVDLARPDDVEYLRGQVARIARDIIDRLDLLGAIKK